MATTIGSIPSGITPRREAAHALVAALRDRAEAIRREELRRLDGRWDGLHPDDRDRLEALTRSIVEALLREPTARLRADGADPESARFLFALDDREGAAA
jgi:glutamyl-tRNA reductase